MAEWIDAQQRRPDDTDAYIAVVWRGGGHDVYRAGYVLGLLDDPKWGPMVYWWMPLPDTPPRTPHPKGGCSE